MPKLNRYAGARLLFARKTWAAAIPRLPKPSRTWRMFYAKQSRHSEAEPLMKRSLAMLELTLGRNHRDVAASLNAVAHNYREQGKYADAEPLLTRSLSIYERALGPNTQPP